MVGKLLSSGISQRRAAMILGVTRKTISRKLVFLGTRARLRHREQLKTLSPSELTHLQLDDLITSQHTKLKPLSLSVVVSKRSRRILAAQVSEIPAFGHLAEISRRKYGPRKNELNGKLREMCRHLEPYLPKHGRIDSDEHKAYPPVIKSFLPNWKHETFKSQRASVAGQGELKSKSWDPLFSINHTLAMLRANINRLIRRTWNTTKSTESMMHHFWVYVDFHNSQLI